ncbi:uncharacterized protein LOC117238115 isoform X1 [Bombus vosnesenskii]|uniref:Uncharacterized protein LOC117238115 isoform X1 n=2 Tax=Pyrobombus TaxID=144703 RepID=A0A6J3KZZ5_9HYME|nr:uncharacterized protein LOC117212348 isoform X1 [Bombus bifarius]XP_033358650.1 uncharacterized protein LOC117238115 isoform X1 [Bombus vosnesenskii]XP_033358651.1 uncharacterized protein LOC117238115 isoform X1 [Bombus vosnesenskii]
MNDDPREVLVLLNSLGFVGITAQQLKAFMKDLKLYRKIKDRERQQKREEIKRKIIDKQKNMIQEILTEQKTEFHSVENTISTNSSNSYFDDTIVKVIVTKLSSDKENENPTNFEENYTNVGHKVNIIQSKSKSMRTEDHCNVKSIVMPCNNIEVDNKSCLKSKNKYEGCLKKDFHIETQSTTKIQDDKIQIQEKSTPLQSVRPMSAPNILDHQQGYIGSSHTKSTSSTKNTHSGTKSFIRPWRLQPDIQKSKNVKKTDPVLLYQKYQQEWKQMSFPGEAKHASIRWAIREKMLGEDPHPAPLPKKSTSMPTLRKK